MKGKLLLWFFGLLLLGPLQATEVQLSGQLFFGEPPTGTPDYPLFITSVFGDQVTEEVIVSMEDGVFVYVGDYDFAVFPELTVTLQVFDFCTGEEFVETFLFTENETTVSGLAYFVCTDILPPPPPEGCDAFFFYEQLSDDPLTVHFFDLSYSDDPITSWLWDFGDGTESVEPEPLHTYAAAGEYVVTLTIQNDSCSATVSQLVYVSADGFCDCDFNNYDPVCVADPATGVSLFFVNPCVAACEGYGPDDFVDCGDNCGCPEYYDPVCVLTAAGDTLTFTNACFAACEGFTPEDFVDCGFGGPCDCDDVFDPVCVATGGLFLVFPNACLAECEGFTPEDFVDCGNDCNCPDIFDPVCVAAPDGTLLTFSNACYAECEGFSAEDFVDCGDECICPAIYDPVCVVTPDGDTLAFENACFAECEGFTPDQWFSCAPDSCDCEDIYDPVCIATPSGIFLPFDNACLAICAGFEPWMFVECNFENNCFANFYIDLEDPESLTVTFVDQSWTQSGAVVDWYWDFGDGTTGTGSLVSHTYAEEGIYEVLLTVSTSSGCTSVTVQHVCVGGGGAFPGPDCQAVFYFEQSAFDPNTLQFVDLSFGNITSWNWDFGDGNTSEEQNPVHTYNQDGIYLVTLTVANADSCTSTMSMLVFPQPDQWYNDECTALFIPFFVPEENLIFFLNLSSPDAVTFEWDLGDGTTSTDPEVVHTYAQAGAYTVTLAITTADGCTNTFEATLNLDNGDFMGSPEFSLLSDTDELESLTELRAYPNPVSDLLTVDLKVNNAQQVQLEIVNLAGQVIRTDSRDLLSGENTLQLPVERLSEGLYLLRLQTTQGQEVVRFVKK